MSQERWNSVASALAICAFACAALGADKPEKYQAYLSPMPHNDAMHANFSGKGNTVVTLDGDTISLNGSFTGLAGAATKAHLCLSKTAGIPGTPLFDVTISNAVGGKVNGMFKLEKSQIGDLQAGRFYIQIDSEKAPNGNLWGWLLPEHEIPGQDVPQKGPWFQLEFAVKTK